MPATTGISAVPTGRPGFEAQGGLVPAYFLSTSAQDKSRGSAVSQLSALMEPDRWFGLPGLILGARLYGNSGDTPGEPYLGYRRKIADEVSLAGIAYGTAKTSSDRLASYHATRFGGELAIDGAIWSPASWFALHGQGSVAATAMSASGTYCVDMQGVAIDCSTDPNVTNNMVDGRLSGVFPSASATLAFDFGRRDHGSFHLARLALIGAAGTMPLARHGMMEATDAYYSLGATLTLGFGD
jgi:hypothetical protein